MPKHNPKNLDLYIFANALRNFLELEPLYQDDRSLKEHYKSPNLYIPEYWWISNFDEIKYQEIQK